MMNWKTFASGAAVSAIALSIAGVANAQVTTSGVRGQVTTETGTPVAGATVTITDPATGLTRSTVTNETGSYSINRLPISKDYDLTAGSDALQGQTYEEVALSLGGLTEVNFVLSADDARTLDTVIVTATELTTDALAVGPNASFNLDTLENAPTINRNITDVLRLDPRVYVDESRGDINPVQCGGKNPRFNSLTLDGVRLNDGFGLNPNGYPTERQPFPYDAIEQVAVELAPFDVQYGGFTACNINAVTKSGTNEFHGVAFFDYTSNDFQGDSLEGSKVNVPDFDEKRYGIQVGGPIVEDKLFFSVAYEKLEGANTFDRGPVGSGAINPVNITQAELDDILNIARTVYNYDPGEIPTSFDNEDEKLLVKLDWNINNSHRAAFTYNYNDGFNTTESDGDLDEFEFSNHLYERGAELNQYVGFLYSDWTDNFSTEFRVGYVDIENRADSIGGTEFGEITIETDDVDVYIGGDDSRQANELNYSILNFAGKGFYEFGAHSITFGYEREEVDIFNLFVQHTQTEIDFDGNPAPTNDPRDPAIVNFELGLADNVNYNNAPSGNPADAAADWGYAVNTLYAQDNYQISPKLNVIVGLRYDFWQTGDKPSENSDFVADYGFSNSQTLDGESLLQPRLAFTYDASDNVTVRGGIGRYSGGDPNVWLSNTYSANNVLQFGADGGSVTPSLEDGATSLFDIPYGMCEDGVTPGPGYCVPQSLIDSVASGTGSNFEINYLDPDFEIPSELKFALGATWIPVLDSPGFMGGEYVVNADLLVSKGQNSAVIRRGDLEQTGVDGRGQPTFDSVRTSSYVLTNSDVDSESITASFSVAKEYDFGLDWAFGYAWNDAKDVQPMTSSVAFSNYNSRAYFDPQADLLSTSNYNIEHRFTLLASYERAFFGDYLTKISTYSALNSGRPYSIIIDDNDPLTPNPYDGFPFFFSNGSLVTPGTRNDERSSWWGKVDLRLEQEFAGFREADRSSAFIVIDNFTNMLSDEWGILREADFPLLVETGDPAESRIGDASRWEVRLGLRYEF